MYKLSVIEFQFVSFVGQDHLIYTQYKMWYDTLWIFMFVSLKDNYKCVDYQSLTFFSLANEASPDYFSKYPKFLKYQRIFGSQSTWANQYSTLTEFTTTAYLY